MKTKTITLYTFDELSEDAKARARNWYREGNLDYAWWDYIFEDAERIGLKITEFDLGGRKHIKGHLTSSVQSVCSKIMVEHGKDCDTYKLAEQWDAKYDDEAEQEENEAEFEHALLEEYFSLLDKEYEYLQSDEQVDESIRCNEYTFTVNGKRED